MDESVVDLFLFQVNWNARVRRAVYMVVEMRNFVF